MRLDRNVKGRGKYLVVNLRKLESLIASRPELGPNLDESIHCLRDVGVVEDGEEGTAGEFFVMMLKDKYSQAALISYGIAAMSDGHDDYARDVEQLAKRAGPSSPFCKVPD